MTCHIVPGPSITRLDLVPPMPIRTWGWPFVPFFQLEMAPVLIPANAQSLYTQAGVVAVVGCKPLSEQEQQKVEVEMKWSEQLHKQLDEVACRLDARAVFTSFTRVAQAANQGQYGKRPLLKLENVTEPASKSAVGI